MVCLILVAFGCQKEEELSIIEQTPTTLNEDGSNKCIPCPIVATLGASVSPTFLGNEESYCSIPFAAEEDAACIAESHPYMLELFISNGSLGIFSIKRNPFHPGLTLTQGTIRWKMKNGSWSSDCSSSYVLEDVVTNSDYLIELEVTNTQGVVMIGTSLCFNVDENQVIRNCATHEIINFTCDIPIDATDIPVAMDLPSDPGGAFAIILL